MLARANKIMLGLEFRRRLTEFLSAVHGVAIESAIAGGIARDMFAESIGVNMAEWPSSGDVDICVAGQDWYAAFGVAPSDGDALGDVLTKFCDACDMVGLDIESRSNTSLNSRCFLIVQGRCKDVDIDVLFYNPKFDTMDKVYASFNTGSNKFGISHVIQDEIVVSNFGFSKHEPFSVVEAPMSEREHDRFHKCQTRDRLLKEALNAKSAKHPYENIPQE